MLLSFNNKRTGNISYLVTGFFIRFFKTRIKMLTQVDIHRTLKRAVCGIELFNDLFAFRIRLDKTN